MSAIVAASISQQRVSIVPEVTQGTTPNNAAYLIVPQRSGSFAQLNKNFPESTLLRTDRSPSPVTGGAYSIGGSILSVIAREASLDKLIESAMASTFSAVAPSAITVAFAAAGKTATRSTGSFLTDAPASRFQVGMWVFGAGTANQKTTLNNGGNVTSSATSFTLTASTAFTTTGGYLKIDSEIIKYSGIAANVVTVTQRGACGTTAATHTDSTTVLPGRQITAISATVLTFGNDTVVDESAVSTTFTTNASVCTTGVTRSYFSVEEQYPDTAVDLYKTHGGCEVNTWQVQVPTEGEVTTEYGLVGLNYTGAQSSGTPTYTATAGRKPASGSATASVLTVDGAAFESCLENLTYNLNNKRAPKFGVGSQSACFVEEGQRAHELSFSSYLVSLAQQIKFVAETRFSLGLTVSSPDLDLYGFYWPSLVYTGAPFAVSGEAVTQQMTARAEYNATDGLDFFVWKAQVTA